ncbi:hypothetical protein H0H93_006148 [Arthromyces matolae]|nr:hypothetical protein H0H93_006148 [Arthromyces matolae]
MTIHYIVDDQSPELEYLCPVTKEQVSGSYYNKTWTTTASNECADGWFQHTFAGTSVEAMTFSWTPQNHSGKIDSSPWVTQYNRGYFSSGPLTDGQHTFVYASGALKTPAFDYLVIGAGHSTSLHNRTIIVDDADSNIVYSGNWSTQVPSPTAVDFSTASFRDTTHWAMDAGASFQYNFNGNSIAIFGSFANISTASHDFSASFNIDGLSTVASIPDGTLDGLPMTCLFSAPILPAGNHTLSVNITAIPSPLAFGFDFLVYNASFSSVMADSAAPASSISHRKAPTGAMVGGLVGGIAFVLGIVAVIFWLRRRVTAKWSVRISPRQLEFTVQMFSVTRRTHACLSQAARLNCHRRSLATAVDDTTSTTNPIEYCKDLVRKHDYEGFLISHFYPESAKGGYFALKAFSVELAMVQEHVSNQTIGKMRMQFWRDAIKGIHEGKPPRHPIALALHQASQTANLPAYHLKRIVDARDAELSTPTHMTMESLTSHAESTSSPLFYLLLSLLSIPSSALSHAASHLGTAQTFTTLLRAMPFHAKKGHVIIPAEITAKHGVRQEDVLRYGPAAEGISNAVFEFATVANDHLITARSMLKEEGMGGKVPTRAMPIFLAGVPIANYLARLEKANFDAFEIKLGQKDWKLPWQIWRDFIVPAFTFIPFFPLDCLLGVMERLCDEVIQIIFYELLDPGPLAHVNKRFYQFSRDPYVRAHYFLAHYGTTEAMFYALGRGKVLDERVLDSSWVRTVPLGVFTHFLKLAEKMYGDIPRAKNEDDGTTFNTFLKQSRWPASLKTVSWETIRDILKDYNDPLMAQFPLALAIEPQLLPYAVKNGFYMDRKYRDFVFRKMFERTSSPNDSASEEIVHNVRELCRLDNSMFISRTIAAEVCMEAKLNVAGYHALKVLDKSGDLRFELGDLVEDLIKTFATTRSICFPSSNEPLRILYSDFPSPDPTARLVMLVMSFNELKDSVVDTAVKIHAKLETFKLTPIKRNDVFNVLLNPFISRPKMVLDYAVSEMRHDEDDRKGMSSKEIKELVQEVVERCLEVPSKGNLLTYLSSRYMYVRDVVKEVMPKYHFTLEDLPPLDDLTARSKFKPKLSRDHTIFYLFNDSPNIPESVPERNATTGADEMHVTEDPAASQLMDLGVVSQETLTAMIRNDEAMPVRPRRRFLYAMSTASIAGKLAYPPDTIPVGHWIKQTFGPRNHITAIFMTHAVVNNCNNILDHFLSAFGRLRNSPSANVPITFEHFKLLAHLGRTPNYRLFIEISKGCDFYLDEEDYLRDETDATRIKIESSPTVLPKAGASSEPGSPSASRGRKRPRRSATTIASYAIPDSDDESAPDTKVEVSNKFKTKAINLQKWVYHLGELLKEEVRKHKESKKRQNASLEPGTKSRVYKSDFYKSLSLNLRELRAKDDANVLQGLINPQDYYSNEDDDEYLQTTRAKKRRTA